MKEKSITASEFDQKFDKGDDMTEFLDLDNVSKPGNHLKRITVDFPEWMVKDLDNISKKLGVSRQSIIKVFPVFLGSFSNVCLLVLRAYLC